MPHVTLNSSSNSKVNQVKQVTSIVVKLRVISFTCSLVGSGQRSIVTATNGSQLGMDLGSVGPWAILHVGDPYRCDLFGHLS